jgi:phage-related protein
VSHEAKAVRLRHFSHTGGQEGNRSRTAQKGQKAGNAKPLKGFGGASVLQITSNFDGDTYRTVYTVQLKGMIYVLHAFQKKSNQGSKTSPNDINKIKARLKTAIELHAERR